jgi:hypothetical protein
MNDIPDCYEAYRQEEMRQRAMDIYMDMLPTCCICEEKIREDETYHEAFGVCVCNMCFDELERNVEYVEID